MEMKSPLYELATIFVNTVSMIAGHRTVDARFTEQEMTVPFINAEDGPKDVTR
jgi:hypothetical protein